uniref:Uncharacterized protein n=1 Tax=Fabrea salina TaxID=342563 RepID=A0A7S3IAM1_9CILI|mmetsp:Transcript_2006/g.3207  ORF Transcript_2006/g.3207 Transcript_2006/m.3207 type:complete len:134 (+) Transcript_2006:230-631(+)
MGAKKAKKGKKGKKKGKKKAKPLLPNLYDIPQIPDCPRQAVPRVNLVCKLVNPLGFPLDFQMEVPVNTRFMTIQDKIIEKHGGAACNITMSLNRFRPEAPVPLQATLMELGVAQPGEVNLFYDYRPVSHPLLT